MLHRILLLTLTLTPLLTSCGDSASAQHTEMTTVMTELADALEGVKDEKGAEAARSTIEPLIGRLAKLQEEAAKAAPKEGGVQLDPDDARELAEATARYSTEIARVTSDPNLAKHLAEVLVP